MMGNIKMMLLFGRKGPEPTNAVWRSEYDGFSEQQR